MFIFLNYSDPKRKIRKTERAMNIKVGSDLQGGLNYKKKKKSSFENYFLGLPGISKAPNDALEALSSYGLAPPFTACFKLHVVSMMESVCRCIPRHTLHAADWPDPKRPPRDWIKGPIRNQSPQEDHFLFFESLCIHRNTKRQASNSLAEALTSFSQQVSCQRAGCQHRSPQGALHAM